MSNTNNPDFILTLADEKKFNVVFSKDLTLNDEKVSYELIKLDEKKYQLIFNNRSHEVLIIEDDQNQYDLLINGKPVSVSVKNKISQILESLGMDTNTEEQISAINAPMPGSILKLLVKQGDEINEGDPILILEAMKMENVIKSPRNGIIKSVDATEAQSVEKGQLLISFE